MQKEFFFNVERGGFCLQFDACAKTPILASLAGMIQLHLKKKRIPHL